MTLVDPFQLQTDYVSMISEGRKTGHFIQWLCYRLVLDDSPLKCSGTLFISLDFNFNSDILQMMKTRLKAEISTSICAGGPQISKAEAVIKRCVGYRRDWLSCNSALQHLKASHSKNNGRVENNMGVHL